MPNIFEMITPQQFAQLVTSQLPPPQTCEVCGKNIPVGDQAINAWIVSRIVIGSVGHPGIPPVQTMETWTCSSGCWEQQAYEHVKNMKIMLLEIESRLGK